MSSLVHEQENGFYLGIKNWLRVIKCLQKFNLLFKIWVTRKLVLWRNIDNTRESSLKISEPYCEPVNQVGLWTGLDSLLLNYSWGGMRIRYCFIKFCWTDVFSPSSWRVLVITPFDNRHPQNEIKVIHKRAGTGAR